MKNKFYLKPEDKPDKNKTNSLDKDFDKNFDAVMKKIISFNPDK